MQNHMEEFREDLKEFHEMTGKFYNGEITVPEYKAFSGGFGSYAQRGKTQHGFSACVHFPLVYCL